MLYLTQFLTNDVSFFPGNKPHHVLIYDNFGLEGTVNSAQNTSEVTFYKLNKVQLNSAVSNSWGKRK